MELYQLRYFLELARQKNFTRAAERLHLAQAALSEQIKKLEDDLGAVLVNRGRRESTLTAAGEALAVHAEALLEHAENARGAVRELVGLRGGRLAIGAIPSVSASLLPKPIAEFRTQHPDVELVLAEGTSDTVCEWVASGRVSLGIIQLPSSGGRFDERVLLTEPFVLLASPSHPVALRKTVDLAKLAKEPFVFYKGRARDTALSACRTAGFEPRIACASGELEAVHALVAAGLGLALLPELAAHRAAPACALLRLRGPKIERRLGLLTRQGHRSSPAAEAFQKLLLKS